MECVPYSVIPSVAVKEVPRPNVENASNEGSQEQEKDMVDSFHLRDLWKAYEEWSAYGAGVPIVLPNGESVVQYYFPSLSAMQIFTYKKLAEPCLDLKSSKRSGEGSSSTESERETVSSDGSKSSSGTPSNDSNNAFARREGSERVEEYHGELYCQYNEIVNPYSRLPLTEKIKELARKYPGLTTFRSTDLTPHSWLAIAWKDQLNADQRSLIDVDAFRYPILQIPVMRNRKELSASFLTYHRLSWSPQGLVSVIPEDNQRIESIIPPRRESKVLTNGECKYEIGIPPFAMSTYKMNGAFWINPKTVDHEMMVSYQRAAWFWLREHKFSHHDYNFFVSHGI
ncbi:uncharacterized protein LOC115669995 [Syzygium oleosum]|uniref:uncharacterized protein LOC115669995 n=1 Tax=Syzygium oleosum TaxID=219896 RepID=UPI0024BACF2B|nr:uncharacterized protein LOC115669995 [Syzygium oleosum]